MLETGGMHAAPGLDLGESDGADPEGGRRAREEGPTGHRATADEPGGVGDLPRLDEGLLDPVLALSPCELEDGLLGPVMTPSPCALEEEEG